MKVKEPDLTEQIREIFGTTDAKELRRIAEDAACYRKKGNSANRSPVGRKNSFTDPQLANAAAEIAGAENVVVFSVGSDGTDGPTDAAGGLADGGTVERLAAAGKTVADVLQNNDAYHVLRDTGDLIITGPTGTNVNDFAAALVR